MHAYAADTEKIREVMHRYGDVMEQQGYRKILEDIEGQGAIGKAVASPRTERALKVIQLFLQSIAKELQKEPPSQEVANALAATAAAYKQVQACLQ